MTPRRPRPQRNLPGGWTGNALVSGVVSAIVAGIISFMVTHYQAISGQQATAITQLESSATTYYNATIAIGEYESGCPNKSCSFTRPNDSTYANDQSMFEADVANISDPKVKQLAKQLESGMIGMAGFAGDHSRQGQAQMGKSTNEAEEAYADLITRCGQIIQGQQ